MAPTSPTVTPASRKALPRIGLAILLAVLATILLLPHINTLLIQSLDRIQHQGPLAAAAFSLLCITSIVLLVPPSPLKLSAGALFGFAIGAPLAWLSVILGSTLAFLLSRYFGRNRIEKKIQSTPTLHAVDQAITQSGWRIVLLARLCPVLPCPDRPRHAQPVCTQTLPPQSSSCREIPLTAKNGAPWMPVGRA